MKNLIRFIFWFTVLSFKIYAQDKYFHGIISAPPGPFISDEISHASKNIDQQELRQIVEFLASDSCKGRELGTEGNLRAAHYIAKKLDEYAIPGYPLPNDRFQKVDFKWVYWQKMKLSIDGFEYRNLWDYIAVAKNNQNLEIHSSEIVFLGFGIDDEKYSDYKGIDVSGKVILIYNGEPINNKGISYVTGNTQLSPWSSNPELKLQKAYEKGVKLVLIVEEKFKELSDTKRMDILSPSVVYGSDDKKKKSISNSIHLSSTLVAKLLGSKIKKVIDSREKARSKGKCKPVIVKTDLKIEQTSEVNPINGNNIIAFIEGSDKKDELVLLSAHYDHIGMRGKEVFNGADDNASGTSSLLQIAKALNYCKSKGFGPRRSILLVFMTGEEKGLLGSMYYVNNPLWNLDKTITNINIDMVGRTDNKYKENTNYIYVIGSDRLSKDLHDLHLQVNQERTGFILDHQYNAENDPNRFYYRSDHYNFAEKGIPAIFFFTGVHEDYHRITDDADKILFPKMEKIARYIFYLALEIANREQSITRNRFE